MTLLMDGNFSEQSNRRGLPFKKNQSSSASSSRLRSAAVKSASAVKKKTPNERAVWGGERKNEMCSYS
jgi:hypothetical protein